jgi:hypothetical protein
MGGSLNQDEINEIKENGHPYNNIKNFVETGTYKGDSTIIAAKNYENVYTIEIFEPLYNESRERAYREGLRNITFLLGDSLERLKEIMNKVTDGSIFFIDAHISGYDSSWNGKIRVPLIEELDIILSYSLGPSVFIFDDLRLWKTAKAWDWAHITNELLIKKFREKNIKLFSYFEKDDRFYVFTK